MPRVQVGDVVCNVLRPGRGQFGVAVTCPGCRRVMRIGATHCLFCKTTFEQLSDRYVQVTGVREYASPH